MVRVGFDLIAIGGCHMLPQDMFNPIGELNKLSCTNNLCQWEVLPQKLKIPRAYFLAFPIPDDFVKCY